MTSICVDIDNVIAQTDETMRQVIREVTGGRVCLDYGDIKNFNYFECEDAKGNRIDRSEWAVVHDRFSETESIMILQPVPGARDALLQLSQQFRVHYATARLPKAWRATIDWLQMHGFPCASLHFVEHGMKHVSLGRFRIAVEDDRDQAVEFTRAGTPCWLLSHPWNTCVETSADLVRVATWEEIRVGIHGLE